MSDLIKFTPMAVDIASAFDTFVKPTVKAGGIDLLKLRKQDGVWVYGQQDIEVEDGAELAIDPGSLMSGFVDWKGGKPVQEQMARLGQSPIDPRSLPPSQGAKGWEEQVGFGLTIISGEDAGISVLYKTNALGGKEAWGEVYDAIKARVVAGKSYVPIVTLEQTSYQHSEYGLIFKPVFKVQRWHGDQPEAPAIEAEAPAEEAAPTRRRRRATAAE